MYYLLSTVAAFTAYHGLCVGDPPGLHHASHVGSAEDGVLLPSGVCYLLSDGYYLLSTVCCLTCLLSLL
jgi:hypothetical protein